MKHFNNYARAVSGKLYEQAPKAVFAAVAVSSLTCGGDYLEDAERRFVKEWWVLYQNGIVPQKPPVPEPAD